MDKELTRDSKYLSYLLRHNPSEVNCDIDKHGWVDIKTLCRNSKFTLSYLELIVAEDTRYEFNSDMTKIRAFHGHSIKGIEPYDEIVPTNELYHGTSVNGYKAIKTEGIIKSMSRNYVHLSKDKDTARRIGSRHGKPVILVIDAVKAYKYGVKFYNSGDDVVLCDNLSADYISDVIEN